MSEDEKKEIAEEAGKRLIWDLLDAKQELSSMSAYARQVIRGLNDISLMRSAPSKDLRVRYNIAMDRGYVHFVWWLLEEIEKGNIKIKQDVQPEP